MAVFCERMSTIAHYHVVSHRNLVIGVRDALAKTGFAQNPCLECGGKWADSAFILP